MKNVADETVKLLNEEELLYEMSNISEKESGLKTKLHIIQNGANRGYQHWARVKVDLDNGEGFPIKFNNKGEIEPINKDGQYNKLSKNNKDIVNNACKYIQENIEILNAYWEGKFEEEDLHDILRGYKKLEDIIK